MLCIWCMLMDVIYRDNGLMLVCKDSILICWLDSCKMSCVWLRVKYIWLVFKDKWVLMV